MGAVEPGCHLAESCERALPHLDRTLWAGCKARDSRSIEYGISAGPRLSGDDARPKDSNQYHECQGQTAVNAGTEAAYTRAIDKGVQGSVVWSATLDGRTRDDHAAMDQQVQDENGLFRLPDGETAPYPGWEGLSAAERINCRCTTRFQIDGYEPALRRSRDEGLVPYQSYAEWSTNQRMF